MIVLDTSILSLALRRRHGEEAETRPAALLRELIVADAPLAVPGIVLQELLSGVRSPRQFQRLESAMTGFPILLAAETHHVSAARISNLCRGKGIACAAVDALIAALTVDNDGLLFTTDADFRRISSCCGLRLFAPPT